MKKLAAGLAASLLLSACGGNEGSPSSSGGSTPIATNRAPVANAGADQSVNLGQAVNLSGSASTDADGDTLTYDWSITQAPNGSTTTLSSAAGVATDFTPDVAGTYTITLTVSDGALSNNATVDVLVSGAVGIAHDGKVTSGLGVATTANLFPQGQRVSPLGSIMDNENTSWTVPADVSFNEPAFPFASDLHNVYVTGHSYANEEQALAALSPADIVEIDADGELITAYIYADNYFELSINGTAVGKDPVPFTEFNSSIAQFKVDLPFTAAMLLVDWEENLATGTELNGANPNHAGDGGVVAVFKNEAGEIIGKTDSSWKAQTFYIAPVTNDSCVVLEDNRRDSSSCPSTGPADLADARGLHWELAANWADPDFDDSDWPSATTYTNNEIGVNRPSYSNFTNLFDAPDNDASFIWSSNVVLDNEVAIRKSIGGATSVAQSLCDIGLTGFATSPQCSNGTLIIESTGIADSANYAMMVGIKDGGWNRQYPAEQPFNGDNAFEFPLTPTVAEEPTMLIRNSVGVAVNGVPIFFPQTPGPTNGASCIVESSDSGCQRDAIVDGEMDQCGGHAGRGNDYHYHQMVDNPGCLMGVVAEQYGPEEPLGIFYDGFPVYPRVLDGSTPYNYSYQDALDSTGVNNEVVRLYDTINPDDSCGGYVTEDGDIYYAVTDGFPYISYCMIGEYSEDQVVFTQGTNEHDVNVSGDITDYFVTIENGQTCHNMVFSSGDTTKLCLD